MKKGVFFTIFAYVLWGFFPIYFKALYGVPAFQIMAHRVVWSFIFLVLFFVIQKDVRGLLAAFNRRTILLFLASGSLLAINWLTYVWAVNVGRVVESSLGYFINPLVSVSLGMIFLKERLRLMQWLPIGFAAAGVGYLTINYGQPPWVALLLAFTFGFYGLLKKTAPLGPRKGLAVETAMVFLPTFGFLIFSEFQGVGAFVHAGWQISGLLILSGVVTSIPLLLFAAGAQSVPLTTVGLLQFIAPTIQFLIGVFLYNEPFSQVSLVGFSLIWLALIIFSVESFINNRTHLEPKPVP
jgi:chloramphenicol-sensitive protein RarD